MSRSRLPGGPTPAARLRGPRFATPILAAMALLLSSIQIPAADRAVVDAGPPDSVVIRVEPAFRAEFQPAAGGRTVVRSRLWRIDVSIWSTAPPDRLTLVMGSEPDDPTALGSIVRAHRGEGASSIQVPRSGPGAPFHRDPSGWSAWEVALRPAAPSPIDNTTQRPGLPDSRQVVSGAISVDSATVAALGPWIGLFDDRGQRLGTGHIRQVSR